EEECAALAAQPAPERVVDADAFLGAKGARDLAPPEQAILRELWDARERLARAADRPPFKVLSEETLVKLARAAPRSPEALAEVTGMTPRAVARWGGAVLDAVEAALALDPAQWPRPERRPRPVIPGAVSRRVEALRRWRAGAAERVGLEPGVLLPNRLIGVVAHAGPRTAEDLARVEGIRRWRVAAFGPELLAAVAAP
ncbi:MAG TPA: HRDC domain-containing protein, partial [Methylomirabilota bacterium]|nr:HRDC domain-containing protein [Methylomirabilota bacterium]